MKQANRCVIKVTKVNNLHQIHMLFLYGRYSNIWPSLMYLYKIPKIRYDIQRIKQFSTCITFLFLSLVIYNYFLIIYEDMY